MARPYMPLIAPRAIGILSLLVVLSISHIYAFQWQWVRWIGSSGNEQPADICTDSYGHVFIAFTLGGPLWLDGQLLDPMQDDAVLLALDTNGQTRWWQQLASAYDDASVALNTHNDAILWGGYFWNQATLLDTTLNTVGGSKGIFVHALHTAHGQRLWSLVLSGSGQKELASIIPSSQGIWLTGYFSDSLFVEPDTLIATGAHDLFALRLNDVGQPIFSFHAGGQGSVRAEASCLLPDEQLAIGGRFKGQLVFGQDTLYSSTLDHDVFVAVLDAQGVPLWARMAGGVHEARTHAISTDQQGHIHLWGSFLGVLNMNDSIGIVTPGFHYDGFWLKWDTWGHPLSAQRIGGLADDQLLDASCFGNTCWLGGSFAQSFSLPPFTQIAADDLPDGWLAQFHSDDTTASQLLHLPGQGIVQLTDLDYTANGWPIVLGHFDMDVWLDQTYNSAGWYDLFVAQWNGNTTSLQPTIPLPAWAMWPNPARESVFFEWPSGKWHLRISNATGQVMYEGVLPHYVDVSSWPPGLYTVRAWERQRKTGEIRLLIVP